MKHVITAAFIPLIKTLEGYKLVRYKDSAGFDTIGVGHLIVKPYDSALDSVIGIIDSSLLDSVTDEQCDRLLEHDVQNVVELLNNILIPVKLSPNQFDALVSLAYNIGGTAFRKSTVFLKLLNDEYEEAAQAFLRWQLARVNGDLTFVKGMYTRRIIEKCIFEGKIIENLDPENHLSINEKNYIIKVVNDYFNNLI